MKKRKLYTTKEVAEIFTCGKLSVATICRYAREKILKAYQAVEGGKWLFDEKDLEAFFSPSKFNIVPNPRRKD